MTKRNEPPWRLLNGDAHWTKFGAKWIRAMGRGTYDLIEVEPGEHEGSDYHVTWATIDLAKQRKDIRNALDTIGMRISKGRIVTDQGDQVPVRDQAITMVEALYTTWGSQYADRVVKGRNLKKLLGAALYAKLDRAHKRAYRR